VTTLAGIHLKLVRYDRRRIDGVWMNDADISATIAKLLGMTYQERASNNCISVERADLVLAGCAILDAIRNAFPLPRLRVADRGLREGMLVEMMREDGALRT
jgi:exopolyphosphatase/guanosine-5'-triphosphate,3'-diphosphate pyrophosphatase